MGNNIDPYEETKKIIKANLRLESEGIDALTVLIKSRKITWNSDAVTSKTGIAFLDEAKRDIKSCKTLFSKKVYPHSVYHLQQAVEKAMKGYCLCLGILSIHEVGGYKGHYTPYILLKGLFEKTGMKIMLQGLNKETADKIGKAWEDIRNPEKRLRIAKMPIQEIDHHLQSIDKYELISKNIINSLNQLGETIKGKSERLPLEISTLSILAGLYILGVVSFPHEEFTRYPDGAMVPSDYTRELGIVHATIKITKVLIRLEKELRNQLS